MHPSTTIVTAQPTALARVETSAYGEAIQPFRPQYAPAPPYQVPPVYAPPPAAAETVISIADIVGYVRRFWKLGFMIGAPLAALTFYALGFGKKVYEAEAKMLIHIQPTNPIQFGNNNNNNGITELSAPQLINNHRTALKTRRYTDFLYSKLTDAERASFTAPPGPPGLKTRLFLALGLSKPRKPMPPADLFALVIDESTRIEPVKDSHILRVIVHDGDPDSAAATANAYVRNYIRYVADDGQTSTRQNSIVLQRQGEEIMAKLAVAEKKLQEYVTTADVLKLGNTSGDIGAQRAESLGRAVTDAEMDLLKATITLNNLRSAGGDGEASTGVRGIGDDSQVVDLRKRLDETRAKRGALDEWCGPRHPRVLALERDVMRLQAQIKDRITEIVQAAETEEKRARTQFEQLRTQLVQARGAALMEGSKQNTLTSLSDEVTGLRELYNQVTRSQKQSTIASEFQDSGQLTIADTAVAPEAPISPKKSMALIAGMMVFGLIGLGLPVSIGLAQDHLMPLMKAAPPTAAASVAYAPPPAPEPAYQSPYQQHAFPSPPAALPAQSSSTQILATLPELMSGEGPIQLGELLHQGPTAGGNAVTQLIALLEKQAAHRRGAGVVLITSANPGEGKSLLASALAASLCTTGRRVFLIECNPTAPSIQNWFPQAGGYNSATHELETLRYGQSNLFVLPAHDLPSYEVSDLLDGYRTWIGKARSQVDWVILDGASLLRGFADVAQLAPLATDVLFIHDATRCAPEQVRAALNLLRPLASAEVMRGMVMNRQTTCAI